MKFVMKMLVNLNRSSIFLTNVFIFKIVLKSEEKEKECLLSICFGLLKETGVILVRDVKMSY